MRNLKLVKVATVRKHMDAHFRGEISYTEAVNRINEDANQALNIANVRQRFFTVDSFEVRFNCDDCNTPYMIKQIHEGEVIETRKIECDCEYNARRVGYYKGFGSMS